ncbi:MAG: DUF1924 domain-containing protein [Azonexus sp.]|nr:DUF1924 domain-containing protein [Azonexus sp.]
MKHKLILSLAFSALTALSLTAQAGPIDTQLAGYKAAAQAADAKFTAFSAERGKAFHNRAFGGGKPDTPACASCHNENPRAAGLAPTGKVIEPVALSATPGRYADPAKVEKWFKRNCQEVLGRACSPQEKGDWLSYMVSQ